jgi:[ribosomal protein S5]-alanine N-acetyltransferase
VITDRLLLREFVEGDWPAVHVYASDPEIYRYRSSTPHTTEEQTRELIRRILARQAETPRAEYFFAVLLRVEARLIGECFLRMLSFEESEAFIGYSLNRDCWGQGYMTEAVRALIGFGFAELGLRRIVSGCHPENVGSRRVMEKAGMRRQLTLPGGGAPAGAPASLLYEVWASDWKAGTVAP